MDINSDMEWTSLTRDQTKKCMTHCQPADNIWWKHGLARAPAAEFINALSRANARLSGWYRHYGFAPGIEQKTKKAALSDWLGSAPSIHTNFEHRTTVWGLLWHDKSVIIYLSKRGLSLEIDIEAFKPDEALRLVNSVADGLAEHARTYRKVTNSCEESAGAPTSSRAP